MDLRSLVSLGVLGWGVGRGRGGEDGGFLGGGDWIGEHV